MGEVLRAIEELRAIAVSVAQTNATPRAVNFTEAARLLAVSAKHVGRLVKKGSLLTVDIGGVRRIPMSEIDRLSTPGMSASNKGNAETEERVRFDGAKALAELKKLRAQRKR